MTLALVGRGVRALSDQLNSYYRVFKGADPDSVYLRLNTGGSFEVRHSATNAPVLKVTDAGVDTVISAGDIADGAITNAKLAPNAVTTDKIADGTVTPADINGQASANRILSTTGGGVVGWNQATAPMIASLNVGAGHLAGGGAGDANTVARTVDGTAVAYGKVLSAMIANQQVGSNHIAGDGVANRVLRTTTGVATAFGQVISADIASLNVGAGHLAGGGAGDANTVARTVDGTAVAYGKVLSAMIANQQVGTNHIAAGGVANRVLRTTDGTATVFGQVISADIANGVIGTQHIASAQITTDLIQSGAVSQAGVSAGFGTSTTSTSFVTMAGDGPSSELRVDLTTQANSLVLMFVNANVFHPTAGTVATVALAVDGAAESAPMGVTIPSANYNVTNPALGVRTTLAAGAHQFRARWKSSTATGNLSLALAILVVVEIKR